MTESCAHRIVIVDDTAACDYAMALTCYTCRAEVPFDAMELLRRTDVSLSRILDAGQTDGAIAGTYTAHGDGFGA